MVSPAPDLGLLSAKILSKNMAEKYGQRVKKEKEVSFALQFPAPIIFK
jgi:hypothetical protein